MRWGSRWRPPESHRLRLSGPAYGQRPVIPRGQGSLLSKGGSRSHPDLGVMCEAAVTPLLGAAVLGWGGAALGLAVHVPRQSFRKDPCPPPPAPSDPGWAQTRTF